MPSMIYECEVRGENFLLNMSSLEARKMGFLVVRVVSAEDVSQAKECVLDAVRAELGEIVLNPKSDPPLLYIEDVRETDEEHAGQRHGFRFYPERGELDPDDEGIGYRVALE